MVPYLYKMLCPAVKFPFFSQFSLYPTATRLLPSLSLLLFSSALPFFRSLNRRFSKMAAKISNKLKLGSRRLYYWEYAL